MGLDNEVDIGRRYRLGSPGIDSRWRKDFSHPSRPTQGPTQPTTPWIRVYSWG